MSATAPSGAPVAIAIAAVSVAAAICAAIFVPTLAAPSSPASPSTSGPEVAAARQTMQVALSSAQALAGQAADDLDAEVREAIAACEPQQNSDDVTTLRDCEQLLLGAITTVQGRL